MLWRVFHFRYYQHCFQFQSLMNPEDFCEDACEDSCTTQKWIALPVALPSEPRCNAKMNCRSYRIAIRSPHLKSRGEDKVDGSSSTSILMSTNFRELCFVFPHSLGYPEAQSYVVMLLWFFEISCLWCLFDSLSLTLRQRKIVIKFRWLVGKTNNSHLPITAGKTIDGNY